MMDEKKSAATDAALDTGRKWQTPRGPKATAAKNKYRDKNYDRMELAIPRGMKQRIEEASAAQGISKNAYIAEAIKEKYQRDTGEEMQLERAEEPQQKHRRKGIEK